MKNISHALTWLSSCITSPAWSWDPEQKAAASDALKAAQTEVANALLPGPTVITGGMSAQQQAELINNGWEPPGAMSSYGESWQKVCTALTAISPNWHNTLSVRSAGNQAVDAIKALDSGMTLIRNTLHAVAPGWNESKAPEDGREELVKALDAIRSLASEARSAQDRIKELEAQVIPGLTMTVGEDGVWLQFRSPTGQTGTFQPARAVKEFAMGHIVKAAIRDWCNARQDEAGAPK